MDVHSKRIATLGLALAVIGGASPAAGEAAKRRPMTVEDLFAAQRVSDPQVSPDGRQIVFSVARFDMEKNTGNTDLWLMPSGGGRPRQLTRHEKADFHPRWLPDGSGILYMSSRSGKAQLWMLPLEGGEARQVTKMPSGVNGFSVGVKGQNVLVTSGVFPDCATLECTSLRLEARAESPVKARATESLLFRHWDTWREGLYSHLFVVPLEGGEPRDLLQGEVDCPPISLGTSHDFVLSPDGREVAYAANTDEGVAWSTNNDVFLIPTQGGQARRLTKGRGNDAGPLYSPDGRYLAYLSMERPGFEADQRRLMIYDRRTKRHQRLAAELDRSISQLTWSSDSEAIYFNAADRGKMPLWRVTVPEGELTEVITEGVNRSLALLPNDQVVIFTRQSQSQPNEIYRADTDGDGEATQLTHFNDELLEGLEMGQVEEFWYEGAGGDRVRSWLIRPPGFRQGQRYPVVFLIHGGPQGSWLDTFHFRWNTQMFAAPGYVVVAMDFHGSPGYGQEFTDAVTRDWGGAPYQDIMAAVDHVLETYDFVDGDRIGAAGASYGGFMVNWILGHTDRFDCLVSHAGLAEQVSMYGATEELWFPEWEFGGVPWENPELFDRFSPIRYADQFQTPTLVIHGEHDYRVPFTQGFQIFTALQRRGVESRLLFFPDETHFISRPQNARRWWQEVHGWLDRFLGR